MNLLQLVINNDLVQLTALLGLEKQAFGMNVLVISYKTQLGDFSGYFDSQNNIIFNKKEVPAHEWLHFVDKNLGVKGHSLTDLMEVMNHNKKLLMIYLKFKIY